MCDYKTIKKEYVYGDASLRELARKHGVCPSTLMGKAHRDGWRKERDAYQDKVKRKVERKLSERQRNREVRDIDLLQSLVTGLLLKAGLSLEDLDRRLTASGDVLEGAPISAKDIKNLASALRDLSEILGYVGQREPDGQAGVVLMPEATDIGGR